MLTNDYSLESVGISIRRSRSLRLPIKLDPYKTK